MTGICEVCRLIDNDLSVKVCQFCRTCNAWICAACWNNLARRARAMVLRRMSA